MYVSIKGNRWENKPCWCIWPHTQRLFYCCNF